jgi:hypothetical protein
MSSNEPFDTNPYERVTEEDVAESTEYAEKLQQKHLSEALPAAIKVATVHVTTELMQSDNSGFKEQISKKLIARIANDIAVHMVAASVDYSEDAAQKSFRNIKSANKYPEAREELIDQHRKNAERLHREENARREADKLERERKESEAKEAKEAKRVQEQKEQQHGILLSRLEIDIKAAIKEGDLKKVKELLNQEFSVPKKVIPGKIKLTTYDHSKAQGHDTPNTEYELPHNTTIPEEKSTYLNDKDRINKLLAEILSEHKDPTKPLPPDQVILLQLLQPHSGDGTWEDYAQIWGGYSKNDYKQFFQAAVHATNTLNHPSQNNLKKELCTVLANVLRHEITHTQFISDWKRAIAKANTECLKKGERTTLNAAVGALEKHHSVETKAEPPKKTALQGLKDALRSLKNSDDHSPKNKGPGRC